jgi:hypothetical protein
MFRLLNVFEVLPMAEPPAKKQLIPADGLLVFNEAYCQNRGDGG